MVTAGICQSSTESTVSILIVDYRMSCFILLTLQGCVYAGAGLKWRAGVNYVCEENNNHIKLCVNYAVLLQHLQLLRFP